jgi:iron complex outermembrane receptor protein
VSPEFDRRVAGELDLREIQTAAYLMQNFEANKLSGNFGVRWVRTTVNANIVNPVPAGKCLHIEPGKTAAPCAAYPDAILTAGDAQTYLANTPFVASSSGLYYKTPVERNFDHVLPSLNMRYDLDKSMVARLGASKTIGRQNYNILGQGFSGQTCAGAEGCVVTGPNPNLRPMTADNFDLAFSWYFAPQSVFSATLFKSNIDGYVKTGSLKQDNSFVELVDPADNTVKQYFVKSSGQQGARIQGIDLSFERPIGWGFGMTSNISRATTEVDDGRPMVGASEWAGNLGGYFENDVFSARLVYNYRGKYVSSSTAPAPTANSQGLSVINGVAMPVALTWAAPVTNVALSMTYKFNKNIELSFNATNLTDPARGQYRYSEDEPQKLDVSGRQYYFNLKYKI